MDEKSDPDGFVWHLRDLHPIHAFLADFNVGGHGTKPAHRRWIDEMLLHRIATKAFPTIGGAWRINLIGRASQSGAPEMNKALSRRRAAEIESHIRARMPQSRLLFQTSWAGEERPLNAKDPKNKLDRSVEIQAWIQNPDHRPPPPPPPPPPPEVEDYQDLRKQHRPGAKKRMTLRFLSWTQVTVGARGIEGGYYEAQVEIIDHQVMMRAVYTWQAGGVGISIGPKGEKGGPTKPDTGSANARGEPNVFWIGDQRDADDFGGWAALRDSAVTGHNGFHFGGIDGRTPLSDFRCKIEPVALPQLIERSIGLGKVVHGPMRLKSVQLFRITE